MSSHTRQLGRFRLYTWTDNLTPYYSWGVELYHHGNVATARHGAEIGVYLYLGPYRLHGSIARVRVTR